MKNKLKLSFPLFLAGGLCMANAASTDSLKTLSDSSIVSMLSKDEKNKVIKFVFQADTSKTVCDTAYGFTDLEREYCRRRHQLWNGK